MKGYYINLDKRIDRRKHFENISPLINTIERFSAIEYSPGYIGCVMSHISVLHLCMNTTQSQINKNDDDYFYIFEDDFMILNMDNFHNFLKDFKDFDVEWDIIILTPRGITVDDDLLPTKTSFSDRQKTDRQKTDRQKIDRQKNINNQSKFKRIIDNQTMSGYIVKKRFIPILIDCMEDSKTHLLNGGAYSIYGVDQYWKKLQYNYKFYYYTSIFGGQLPGWSDIEQCIVDYNQRYLEQNNY